MTKISSPFETSIIITNSVLNALLIPICITGNVLVLAAVWSILGDPGAVSRAGRKGATKVFKHGRKSPWVPTLTGTFPNGQANAGS